MTVKNTPTCTHMNTHAHFMPTQCVAVGFPCSLDPMIIGRSTLFSCPSYHAWATHTHTHYKHPLYSHTHTSTTLPSIQPLPCTHKLQEHQGRERGVQTNSPQVQSSGFSLPSIVAGRPWEHEAPGALCQ